MIGQNNPDPKTKTPSAIPRGGRIGTFIIAGQSNGENAHDLGYKAANPLNILNLDPLRGGVYLATEPLVGCATHSDPTKTGNMLLVAADLLVSRNVFSDVVLIPVAMGGSTIAMWDGGPTEFWKGIMASYRRGADAGLAITGILWQHGESDNALATPAAKYVSDFMSMAGKVQASGCSAPWMIANGSYNDGAISTVIQAALRSLVDGKTRLYGADTDSLGDEFRYDRTHLNMAGKLAGAKLWAQAIGAAVAI